MQLARFGVFTADDGLCNDLNGECRLLINPFQTNGISHKPTVKDCLKRPLKKSPKYVFNTDTRLLQVKSIAECSRGAFCNTFDLH